MKKNINKNKKAFTLIEVLIAASITASVIGVTFTFYTFAYKHILTGRDEIFIHKKVRIVLEQLEKDIRNCKEIVKIGNSSLELKVFKNEEYSDNHVILSDDDLTNTVKYKLKKGGIGHYDELQYSVGKALPYTIMKFEKIDENIFTCFTFDLANNFIPFDSVINDSYQRERISLVIINLKLTQKTTSLELSDSVSPRYLYGKKKSPYWNFNKNAQK